jgi:putative transposase
MTDYRRVWIPGARVFFTVNLAERAGNRLLVDHIDQLRSVFRQVRERHPFTVDAMVILPEHLHCIWTLPEGDADYKTRWALIKAEFSRGIPVGERRSASRRTRGERGIWQRRYWEHVIRDERDYARHVDYIHWNPVKHGWVTQVVDWPYSSFHGFVRRGLYPSDWACDADVGIDGGE